MSTVEDIKNAIEKLPKGKFWKISRWIIERHDFEWHKQIEADIHSGNLDRFAEEALREHREGQTPHLVILR